MQQMVPLRDIIRERCSRNFRTVPALLRACARDEVRGLAFGGGGSKNTMLLHMVDIMERLTPGWELPRMVRGTSSGVLVALVIALQLSSEERREALMTLSGGDVIMRGPIWWNLLTNFNDYAHIAVSSQDGIRDRIEALLTQNGLSKRCSLAEFRALTGSSLECVATSFPEFGTVRLNADNCPDVAVVDAALASMAHPGIYAPVILDLRCMGLCIAQELVDGGVTAQLPPLDEGVWGIQVISTPPRRLNALTRIQQVIGAQHTALAWLTELHMQPEGASERMVYLVAPSALGVTTPITFAVWKLARTWTTANCLAWIGLPPERGALAGR